MKYSFTSFCILCSLVAVAQQQAFTLKGNVAGLKLPVSHVAVQYAAEGMTVADTAKVTAGVYEFNGNLPAPTLAYFTVFYQNGIKTQWPRDFFAIYLEPGQISVHSKDSASDIYVKGSAAHETYLKLQAKDREYMTKISQLHFQGEGKDGDEAAAIREKTIALDAERREKVYGDFVRGNPGSTLAIYALEQYAGPFMDADQVEPLFELLPATLKNSYEGKSFAQKIAGARRLRVGIDATDFQQADATGNMISLSSFRGKYVLVDFWASWCKPCREENPNLVRAYDKYRNEGFTILGVALERSTAREAWLKAIEKDGLAWTQVSDFKFFDNEAAKLYGIRAIPQNMLIGPDGKIIATNLRGEALEEKLEELFGKSAAWSK